MNHARREYNPNNNRQGQNGGDALSDALIQKNNDLGVPSNNETPSSNWSFILWYNGIYLLWDLFLR